MDPEDRPASSGDDPIDDDPADGDPDGDDPVDDGSIRTDRATGDPPTRTGSEEDPGLFYRFRHDMEGPLMWLREMLSSIGVVLLIGLILFAVSGVWPPMVAVESSSMEPNMNTGDLVFVTEPGRLAPDAADNEIGVVTHEAGEESGYRTFGDHGSVVIYQPPGRRASPIIHRAMFHVEAGENWYDRADDRYHGADDCEELRNCPAPHAGFVTLGDNNRQYDQANGLAEPVAAEWVTGVARLRVPYLGYVRLITTGQAEVSDVLGAAVVSPGTASGAVGSSGRDPWRAGPPATGSMSAGRVSG
ncbi:S26 family signal peptidase [Halorubrum halodurans]|uniref:S26 family signal peptidase n=1 Tax=Halorubrum halodurans TaxID=1383851 RepID=UPI001FED02E4|nr:S26 family signal peptidase [Halorubrum halodurans]